MQIHLILESDRSPKGLGQLTEIAQRLHDDPADSCRLIGARVLPHFRRARP